ncbi:MAG: HAD-IG family 5'-nucleotidase [Bacteriovoracales bacterium]|nr:HAD-IG family 5'-nucleotidase [Bacteriovoracales bacterium]
MGIYVNRTLDLKKIKAIGFDMDCTLVRYHTEAFERQTFEMARERLVTLKGYPKEIFRIDFDFQRVIRGLVIDEKRGNLIKGSLYGRIKKASHGLRSMDFKTQRDVYDGQIIDPSENLFTPIDTSFSISHGVLFSYLVDLRDQNPKAYPPYEEIARDVVEMIDLIHRDQSLKDHVAERMHQFFIQDKKIPLLLERLKHSGKTLFIVTDSDHIYAQKLLDFTMTPFLRDHSHWMDLFDIVVTLAGKPQFFTAGKRFLKVDMESDQLVNIEGKLAPGIFRGGNSKDLQDYLNLSSDEILYIGDHIYGDVVALKKVCGWRTALIVEEIDGEIENLKKGKGTLSKLNKLMAEKEKCEDEIDKMIDSDAEKKKTESLFGELKKIDQKLKKIMDEYHAPFNPYWGELMRSDAEESLFAGQVAKYACIYMAKVSDLADVSSRKCFRPRRRPLPHDD